ncbi:MAG: Y-family DNA polymerase [Rikenellaceae bacterium]
MFALCDCNNFFVSCQRVFRPELNGKPVVVLSNNDGCVIARSNEAKALQISMGMPLFKAQPIINRYNVEVFSSNYKLYGDMSQRVMSILRDSAPNTEVYSIDEAFMDFTGMDISTLEDYARELSQKVKKHTGIPVSIGIAPTKTLAKIASKLCKQYPKLRGACLMHRHEDIDKVLKKFPVEDVWGIGRKHAKRLHNEGICSAYDFANMSPVWVQNNMSITGLRTQKELKGESSIGFEYTKPSRQSICVSRSFAREIEDFESLRTSVATFASHVSEKLRAQNSLACQMQVFIYTNRFKTELAQSFENALIDFSAPTDSTLEITKTATLALKKIFKQGYGYKKAGVVITKLCPKNEIQASLFEPARNPRHDKIMEVMDKINGTNGRGSIKTASQGKIAQFSSRERVSPEYTTKWDDILQIKV